MNLQLISCTLIVLFLHLNGQVHAQTTDTTRCCYGTGDDLVIAKGHDNAHELLEQLLDDIWEQQQPADVFPKGDRAPEANFTGTVWLYPLVKADTVFNFVSGSVSFEPGARSNWHRHPAGQVLFITKGIGYYQEKGQAPRILRRGDVIQCQPGIEHWHGAAVNQGMTHIAINTNPAKGVVVWLQRVNDEEYNKVRDLLDKEQ